VLGSIPTEGGNKEIAGRLEIPESKVKQRIRSAMQFLNARDRTHAVTKALKQGIIEM
jgi:two-component system, NarL family, response regulator